MVFIINYLREYYFLGALFLVIFSFLMSYKVFPVIINLSNIKNLHQEPEERSSHKHKTPNLGGIGIFFGFTLTIATLGSILSKFFESSMLLDLIAALLILFFIGVKDDLIVISPLKKLIAQLLAASIVVFLSDVQVSDFNGFLGIYQLPYLISLLVTFFTFVLVINAYNLIDGIDGLAGSIALIIFVFFGFYFLINKQVLQVLISLSLIGPLLAFLKYNLSSNKKIFMGDTGSMVIGFVIVYQSINFLNINQTPNLKLQLSNGPVFIIALLSFPLLDTLRVFTLRLVKGNSPFRADRNHLHHCFIDYGFSHLKSTLIIVSLAFLVVVSAFLLQKININIAVITVSILSSIVYLFITTKIKKGISENTIK
jgi:UDP-N-acetylmuramyl pentapeptide phosphotransferase/UDP-N-acetylglucosamine-1-phosphate transferase